MLVLLGVLFGEGLWKKYNPLTGAWPSGTLTYYNNSEYDKTLRAAFRRWEATGIPIRFRETDDKDSADLLVHSSTEGLYEKCGNEKCSGWATIGHTPLRQAEMWLLPPSNPLEDRAQDFLMIETVIHEVGHILGLGHNKEMCSIMNSGDRACRAIARPRFTAEGREMLCGPWKRDLDNLRELYPEVGTKFSAWCVDRAVDWDFLEKHGDKMLEGIELFRQR